MNQDHFIFMNNKLRYLSTPQRNIAQNQQNVETRHNIKCKHEAVPNLLLGD